MGEWIIHNLKKKSTNIKTKHATFWQDIVLLFLFFSVLMFAAQRSQILRQEWKIRWKVQVGKGAYYRTYYRMPKWRKDDKCSVSILIPATVPSFGRESRQTGRGVRGGFVWSGWLHLRAHQFWPGCQPLVAAVYGYFVGVTQVWSPPPLACHSSHVVFWVAV